MLEALMAAGGSDNDVTFTIVPNSSYLMGGSELEFSIFPENALPGWEYYWSIETDLDPDLIDGPLSGFVSFVDGLVEIITIKTKQDPFLDGEKAVKITIKPGQDSEHTISTSEEVFFVYSSHPVGEKNFIVPGEHQFTVPDDVEQITAVCVGGGQGSNGVSLGKGGGGGDLRWRNEFPVMGGETLTIIVGEGGVNSTDSVERRGKSSLIKRGDDTLIQAAGGGDFGSTVFSETIGGGDGGRGGYGGDRGPGGGGGAGGYSGNGGDGGDRIVSAKTGDGGGAGGGAYYYTEMNDSHHATPGGGVALRGQKNNGSAAVTNDPNSGGGGGSGGDDGTWFVSGIYGGGGRGQSSNNNFGGVDGANGAVLIVWGPVRRYPNENIELEV